MNVDDLLKFFEVVCGERARKVLAYIRCRFPVLRHALLRDVLQAKRPQVCLTFTAICMKKNAVRIKDTVRFGEHFTKNKEITYRTSTGTKFQGMEERSEGSNRTDSDLGSPAMMICFGGWKKASMAATIWGKTIGAFNSISLY